MLYIQPQGSWSSSSQRDLPYWLSAAPSQTSSSTTSAERSTLMPFTMRGALPPSPTPNDEMDLDSPRSSSAGPVWPQPYQRPQYQQYHHHIQQQQQPPSPPPQHHQQLTPQSTPRQLPQDMAQAASSPPGAYKGLDPSKVAAALEVARDSPDGAQDPEVSGTLESALSQIWNRVLAQPDSYVMTKGEFAVFNLYQHLFLGNQLATAARRRFWDNTHG